MNRNTNSMRLLVGGAAAAAGAIAAYARVVRPWYLRWGAAENEVQRRLPGDERVPEPRYGYTRAITINATIDQVWQWLVQIGQNRGGLYSYEWLENLMRADIHNAERVIPEYQNLTVGDYILLYPNGPSYAVAQVEAPRTLVLQTVNSETGEFTTSVEHDGAHGTWTFVLEPRIDNTTRLLVRARLDYEPVMAARVLWGAVEPINFVMERKMLKGIKKRAESHRVPDVLLDRVMREYEFRGIESIHIHATPAQVLKAIAELKASDLPLPQLLGQIRSLPMRFAKESADEPVSEERLADVMRKIGFVTLAADPSRQIIVGAIGKFHEIADPQIVRVRDPQEFQRFLHEDYQKLAVSVHVTGEDPKAGCTLTLEHRTHAMSEHARKQFARYWLAIRPGGGIVSHQLLGAVKRRAEQIAKRQNQDRMQPSREPEGTSGTPSSKRHTMPLPELVGV